MSHSPQSTAPGPDLRLDGYTLADEDQDHLDALTADPICLTELVAHHSADGLRSDLVWHDSTATFGLPGAPQLLAMTVTRTPEHRTARRPPGTVPGPAHISLPSATTRRSR